MKPYSVVTPEIAVMGESENKDVKQLVEDGTEKSTQETAVKTETTDSSDKPTSDKPAESSDKPTSDKPTDSSDKPAESSDKPAESSDKPDTTPASEAAGPDPEGTGEGGIPTAGEPGGMSEKSTTAEPGGMSEETRRMLAEIDQEAEIEARRSSLLPPDGSNDTSLLPADGGNDETSCSCTHPLH